MTRLPCWFLWGHSDPLPESFTSCWHYTTLLIVPLRWNRIYVGIVGLDAISTVLDYPLLRQLFLRLQWHLALNVATQIGLVVNIVACSVVDVLLVLIRGWLIQSSETPGRLGLCNGGCVSGRWTYSWRMTWLGKVVECCFVMWCAPSDRLSKSWNSILDCLMSCLRSIVP